MGSNIMDILDGATRQVALSSLRSVRLAVLSVLAIGGSLSSPTALAQSCPGGQCPPITVYASPWTWGSVGIGPGGNGWTVGWDTTAYYDPYAYQDPPLNCPDWEALHPRPAGCGEPSDVTTNGCGPEGFGGLVPDGDFGPACNVHDICYSQVGTTRGACDDELDVNMGNTCQEYYGCYYDHETHSTMCNGTTQQLQGCHNYRNTIMNAIRGSASGIMAARFETLQEEAACRAWHNARYTESTCVGP